MAHRLAESLKLLRTQFNTMFPMRDTRSDGWIGDTRHASKKSDHNPWFRDSSGIGVVTALDIDEDLGAPGVTLADIVNGICASKDPRVKYIIYEKRITVAGSNLQAWKRYNGSNPHDKHVHISVKPHHTLYDNTEPWSLEPVDVALPTKDVIYRYVVVPGDSLWGLARRFKTSVQEIQSFNSMTGTTIRVGQILRVK